jgi:hypothetical protein
MNAELKLDIAFLEYPAAVGSLLLFGLLVLMGVIGVLAIASSH